MIDFKRFLSTNHNSQIDKLANRQIYNNENNIYKLKRSTVICLTTSEISPSAYNDLNFNLLKPIINQYLFKSQWKLKRHLLSVQRY